VSDREDGDELFEDLDKFFAPIQDVEWPEPGGDEEDVTEEPAEPAREHVDVHTTEALEPGPQEEVAPAAAFEPTGEGVEFEGVVVRPARQVGEPAGEGGLFEDEPAGAESDWPTERMEVGETSDEDETPTEEEEYVDSAPQPESGELPPEEAVEEAAEHFAESVRAGTGFDEPGAAEEPVPVVDEFVTEVDMTIGPEGEEVTETILSDLVEGAEAQPARVGGEGMVGPSWEEPTAVEIGAESEQAPGPRDMPAAFLTGLALAIVALGALAISKGAFAVVAGILVLLAQGELYFVMLKRHLQPATAVGLLTGALVVGGAYFHGEPAMLAMVALGTVATFVWYMAQPSSQRRRVTVSIGFTLLPVVYVPLLAGYALVTLALPPALDGQRLMMTVIALTVVYDMAAFAVGSIYGNRPLAPAISPKKSWEGVIGATLVVIIVAAGLVPIAVDSLDTIPKALGLALVVAVFAPLGDLAESMLKRDLGVKDMGSILPGHGGVLDRIDSLLFVAPAAFLYFRLFL
jgi:phosphatidate cytidylyltransferase